MAVNNFPVIPDDIVVTKYTDYYLNIPEFFIEFIQKEIKIRDIKGLTDGRISSVNITGEHPLVLLTGAVLSSQNTVDVNGFLPAISVVCSDEVEENITFGYSKRNPFIIDSDWVATFKANHGEIESRIQDGLLSDNQLDKIEQAVRNATNAIKNPKGQIIAYLDGHLVRDSIFVSVWTQSIDEQNIIGNSVRSIIFDMRKEMVNRSIKDISIQSSKGLVNTNFGRILHGQETTMSFLNVFHTVTVTTEVPTENMIDNTNNITIFDTAQDAYIDLLGYINNLSKYKGVATNDAYVDTAGNEI